MINYSLKLGYERSSEYIFNTLQSYFACGVFDGVKIDRENYQVICEKEDLFPHVFLEYFEKME